MAKAVAKKETTPAFLKEYAADGKGSIHSNEILMPRIYLGQAMTPIVREKKAEEGDFIDSITGDVICPGTSQFNAIVLAKKTEYILWKDRENGSGVFDRAKEVMHNGIIRYQWNKPNQEYDDKLGGKIPVKYVTKEYIDEDHLGDWGTQLPDDPDSPPAATCHFNYILVLPDQDYDAYAISLSRSAFGRGKLLNSLLQKGIAKNEPIWGRVYSVSSFADQSGDNIYANWDFKNNGYIDPDAADLLHSLYDSLADKEIVLDEVDRSED